MAILETDVESIPYPFQFNANGSSTVKSAKADETVICRASIPSVQATKLRALVDEAARRSDTIVAIAPSYDTLSSKLVEQAGFPALFLSGFNVAASLGLPDTGYIAFQEMAQRIQETVREVSIPIIADIDTGYGAPMNVKRTIKGLALAGAAGVMIEDQEWPKRCGHTTGKAVVSREEAYARVQAAVDARNECVDIWIMARTDSLILGYDEALTRAKKFQEIGADCIFVEALPDRAAMAQFAQDMKGFPIMANIMPGGRTENVPASDLANLGYAIASYTVTLLGARIKGERKILKELKQAFAQGTEAPAPLSFEAIADAVGFKEYYEGEEHYVYSGSKIGKNGHQWSKE